MNRSQAYTTMIVAAGLGFLFGLLVCECAGSDLDGAEGEVREWHPVGSDPFSGVLIGFRDNLIEIGTGGGEVTRLHPSELNGIDHRWYRDEMTRRHKLTVQAKKDKIRDDRLAMKYAQSKIDHNAKQPWIRDRSDAIVTWRWSRGGGWYYGNRYSPALGWRPWYRSHPSYFYRQYSVGRYPP